MKRANSLERVRAWCIHQAKHQVRRRVRRSTKSVQIALARAQLRTIPRQQFLAGIATAVREGRGYATGKVGKSQKSWMYYEIVLKKERRPERISVFEDQLRFHGLKQVGIFPGDPAFFREFNRFYVEHVRNLDCLGICFDSWEPPILRHYGLKNPLVHYFEHEPDRSIPSREENCYLPYFRDMKLLIVCPFAEVLKRQATRERFEGVWSNIGKKWFYPRSVDALEFPYGFAVETHRKYGTALNLFEHIRGELERRDFDVALIGAGGLAIPIASHVKSMGRIGIDLGGHLQFLFGVLGRRWRDNPEGLAPFLNEYWIDMPAQYRPREKDVCDRGAYW